jgi:hypothetical protein
MVTYTVETGLRKIPVSLIPNLFSQGLKKTENSYRETLHERPYSVYGKIKLYTSHLGQDALEGCLLLEGEGHEISLRFSYGKIAQEQATMSLHQ